MSREDGFSKVPGMHVYEDIVLGPFFPDDVMDRLKDFKMDPTDILISGFPKSGTTWVQEIAWLVWKDVDIEAANAESVWQRVPLIESRMPGKEPGIDTVERRKAPRMYKTHLPVKFWRKHLAEAKAKVIMGMRNPKDVMVSYYHFAKSINKAAAPTWDAWFEMHQAATNKLLYGGWNAHTRDWLLEYKDDPNVLFVQFEDTKSDPEKTIHRIAEFLGKKLSKEQVQKIVEHTSFKSMKANPATNLKEYSHMDHKTFQFQRKGSIGTWKELITDEQNKIIDEQYEKAMEGLDMKFDFE